MKEINKEVIYHEGDELFLAFDVVVQEEKNFSCYQNV
jgi:hypothetical protein